MKFYAHSGMLKRGIPPQAYETHILNMFLQAKTGVAILTPMLQKAVLLGVLFHDFGKLIPSSQAVLCLEDRIEGASLVNHVDAGVCYCLREHKKSDDIAWLYAAYLIHAHHIGLQDRKTLFTSSVYRLERSFSIQDAFRDTKFNHKINKAVDAYYDEIIDELYAIQASLLGEEIEFARSLTWKTGCISAMDLRFALSVLVDCDHTDTGRNYGSPTFTASPIRASERLSKLESMVDKVKSEALGRGITEEVVASRTKLFNLCQTADLSEHSFYCCDAPVGKGKTFSLMETSLRLAQEKKRDRIFFIIPFTNIISQSVKNYRDLTLPGEDTYKIVNEIHSKVEYNTWVTRVYSHQWNAPINISTSVQFFESLFSNFPSAVRKLQQFANSVIVFDEYHTALPHHLWKVALRALAEISTKYNIDFIFGSGTHVHYWGGIFEDIHIKVKDIVPDATFDEFAKFERDRVHYVNLGIFPDDTQFYDKFLQLASHNGELKGNTVIVCNTVRNSVSMTDWFKSNYPNWRVFHMSSYLTPKDRETILAKIHLELKGSSKILLVATSVVECGVDFSFDAGFREYGSMMSTIQFGGRVNRNKEHASVPIYEFMFDSSFLRSNDNFSYHSGLAPCIAARRNIPVNSDNCTAVIKNEVGASGRDDLASYEDGFSFRTMDDKFQVIKNLTESVIVSEPLMARIKAGELVSPVEINRNSVSVYRSKLDPDKNNNWVGFVEKYEDMLFWVGPYDSDIYGIYAFLFKKEI